MSTKKHFSKPYLLFCCLAILLLSACGTSKKLKYAKDGYRQMIITSPLFNEAFTGFALHDPQKGKALFEHQADKFFTPASNTKIFTLYTALNILGDSLPVLQYFIQGDSLYFWGTGSPTLLHTQLPEDNTLVDFLSKRTEKLLYYSGHFKDHAFGPGWSWDDYLYYYQPEKSPLPMYGNVVQLSVAENQFLQIEPPYFASTVKSNPYPRERVSVKRNLENNQIQIEGEFPKDRVIEVPFKTSDSLVIRLLENKIKKKITQVETLPASEFAPLTIYQTKVDTVYRRLMYESDNFIAEQLLLASACQLTGDLNSRKTIAWIKENRLNKLPHNIRWVDGSGLSRYNAMTPSSIVYVLNELLQLVDQKTLLSYFPAGGHSGTVKNYYKNTHPYVFAKTGTLTGVHCLSGYLKTAKGKLLTFSFMHNNYRGGSTAYKKEMEGILQKIYDTY